MRSPLKIILLLCLPLLAHGQSVEDTIRQVENNLAGWVTFENEPPTRWNLQERLQTGKMPGVSIAVIKDYKVHWARGYGFADVAEKRPVTAQTLFQAASISKSLNGVAMLKLVQQGKLNLDEDINRYLNTWHPSADSGKITLAHLLSHTAGLTIHGFPGYEVTDTLPTVEQILRGVPPANTKEVKPAFAPGKKVQYSGGGTTVTQLILTTVTGKPYDQYLQQEVLDPMGMTSSFYTQPAPAAKKQLLATAYRQNGKPVEGKYHVYPEMAAAGLWTNPTDLARYIIETQLSYAGRSSKVLTPATTKTRLTPFMSNDAALGVFLTNGNKYFSHNGGNEGFKCTYSGSLDGGYGFVIMTNSDDFSIVSEVMRSIALTYGWNDLYDPVVEKSIQVPADTLRQYTGRYTGRGVEIDVTLTSGRLHIALNGSTPMQTHFTAPGNFVLMEMPMYLRFDKTGTGFDLVARQMGQEMRFAKQPEKAMP
ncbi:hypothetical protein DLD77_02940 [Chitinophaga alhagiae]|uniref:Beta-lactamase-related domain-containing protein n=1 Tax=Chitinophaga alhagiae TaxID=2203219 RepID=A0ABN5LQE7_9BACT|nr:serine hydrolase domain-containing protein [Chitinophaga alhagiae]AWO00725.1 hypothetical protein DLD77_02940 [Chitinophaga alhagiae]